MQKVAKNVKIWQSEAVFFSLVGLGVTDVGLNHKESVRRSRHASTFGKMLYAK